MKEKKKAFTSYNKGFHLTFPNGWTVSVQFGPGNYSDNYDKILDFSKYEIEDSYKSNTAEIWAWNNKNKKYPESPKGWQTMRQTINFIDKVRKFRR